MAEYNIISQSIWHSEKFKTLKDDQFSKLVFLYLVNSPHSNSCGCYAIHIGYIMADLNCSEKDAKEAIESLTQRLLIEYNYEENTVLIPNFMEHNPPRNPNHGIKVLNDSLSIPCKNFRQRRAQEILRVIEGKGWKVPKEKRQIVESLTPSLTPTMTKNTTPNPTQPNPTHLTKKKNIKKKKNDEIEKPDEVNQETWDDFLKQRKKKKSDLTETALKGIIREQQKTNLSLEEALQECLNRGWTGFKADWINKDQTKGKNHGQRNNIGEQARDLLDELGQG